MISSISTARHWKTSLQVTC